MSMSIQKITAARIAAIKLPGIPNNNEYKHPFSWQVSLREEKNALCVLRVFVVKNNGSA